jgi:hypothetical protein
MRAPRVSSVELGELLSGTVGAVVRAQEELDEHAQRRLEEIEGGAPGHPVLPPLAYTFTNVALELEMTASVAGSRLLCQTLDPGNVGLYGYQASSGLRVRLVLAPRSLPVRRAGEKPGETEGTGG